MTNAEKFKQEAEQRAKRTQKPDESLIQAYQRCKKEIIEETVVALRYEVLLDEII